MAKQDHYLAVRETNNIARDTWDMLRYDACYPISNAPDGWVILKQPYRDGIRGGFTIERWESFGFRGENMIVGSSHPSAGTPSELYHRIRLADERAATRKAGAL
jgi:hypothetical protein